MCMIFFYGCSPHKEEISSLSQHLASIKQPERPLKDSPLSVTPQLKEIESTFVLEDLNQNKLPTDPIPRGHENAAVFNNNNPDLLNAFPYIILKTKQDTHAFQFIKTYINTHFTENNVTKPLILSMSVAYLPVRASKIHDMSDIWNSLNFNKIDFDNVHEDVCNYLEDYESRKHSKFFIKDNITVNLTNKRVDYSKTSVRSIAPTHDIANKRALIDWDEWYKDDNEFSYIEAFNLNDYAPIDEEAIHVLFYMKIEFLNEGKRLYLNVPMNYDNMNLSQGVYHQKNRTSFLYELL